MCKYVIGVDYGTDSVRSVVVNASTGAELGAAVFPYPRWKKGYFCDPNTNQFRQHPLDYIEGLESSICEALDNAGEEVASQVVGIAVDTTGSTPVAVDQSGTPLALLYPHLENPNAMFVLWKDHTAIKEAEEINTLSNQWHIDYTQYVGGIYSSEWFWAKILHVIRIDPHVRSDAYSWVEHCDWIPFLLTGGTDVSKMYRSRCAAGHKAMWHSDFGGLPSNEFLATIDPLLDGLRDRLYRDTFTSDVPVGSLSLDWAKRLGLSTDVVVSVGAFDAHMGAVGGQIEPYYLSKVMGTSTCDMLVAPADTFGDILVKGICGQVDGSVIPGMIGLEAGQSAFGDVYAWFRQLLAWPLEQILGANAEIDEDTRTKLVAQTKDQILVKLSTDAGEIDPLESGIVAMDWLNGRRTPDANQALKGALIGLNLSSDAPKIFRALVEATCFGARKIVDRFQDEGVPIRGIIGLGGVAQKSPFTMQILADVLDRPIKIARSEQTCALGAAMFAATAAGLYNDVMEAMQAMGPGFDVTYRPKADQVEKYHQIYARYEQLATLVEQTEQSS
ncbi:MAG: ribulokinase [Saprospiraceae bacterium]|nr:ribulokinase [Saprospiraceae bacterium]